MARHFGLTGVSAPSRRSAAASDNMQESDVKEPKRLLDIIKRGLRRISDLECNARPETVDFEVQVPSGGSTLRLNHGLNSNVRWWPMSFRSGAANSPLIREDYAASTMNMLVLIVTHSSANDSHFVVRIEASPFTMTTGV